MGDGASAGPVVMVRPGESLADAKAREQREQLQRSGYDHDATARATEIAMGCRCSWLPQTYFLGVLWQRGPLADCPRHGVPPVEPDCTADAGTTAARPLPLEMRVLGALLVAHGVAPVTVEKLAGVLNMSALTINGALMRMLEDGIVCNAVHGSALFWALADDFLTDAGQCPTMGKVLPFPAGAA